MTFALRLEMPVALELDHGPELARERIAERVLPRRHLVDAGVPRGTLWARTVEHTKPSRSFVDCPTGRRRRGAWREAGVLVGGAAIYARGARRKLPIWIFCIAMLGMQYSNTLMPLPESTTQFAMMALASYFGLAAAAWFVEKKWGGVC